MTHGTHTPAYVRPSTSATRSILWHKCAPSSGVYFDTIAGLYGSSVAGKRCASLRPFKFRTHCVTQCDFPHVTQKIIQFWPIETFLLGALVIVLIEFSEHVAGGTQARWKNTTKNQPPFVVSVISSLLNNSTSINGEGFGLCNCAALFDTGEKKYLMRVVLPSFPHLWVLAHRLLALLYLFAKSLTRVPLTFSHCSSFGFVW
jgi:hypothetical protein